MASRIAGITIEIGGNTTKLQKSLQDVDKKLKTTASNLKDVNKLLQMKPGNVELLTQKQKQLSEAISLTKTRLQELKAAQSNVQKGTAEWDALQREIIATEGDLKNLQKEMRNFGNVSAQQIKAVGGKLQAVGSKVEEFGQKLKGVSGAAAAIGTGLLKLGYDAMTSADDLMTLSQQTGISTDELQKMQYASDLVDVSLEDITGALRKMKAKMDPTNETFKQLGVALTDADGHLRSATDVFYDTVTALSQIQNETERDQVAMDLFGKSADQLAGIIDDGGAALKQYGDEAESMGLILSGDTLEALNDTNDTMDKLKAQMSGTMAQIGADVASVLAPALQKAGDFIGKITEKLRALTPEQTETILKIIGVVSAIAPVLIIGGKLIAGIGTLISMIGSVVGVLGGPLTIAIGAIIALGVLVIKNWDKIVAKVQEIKEKIVNAWSNMKDAVVDKMNAMKNVVSEKWDAIKQKYEEAGGGLKGIVSATVEGIKQYFTLGFDVLNALTGGKLNEIKEKFQTVLNKVKDTVRNAIDKIKSFFNVTLTFPHIKLPHFRITAGKIPWGIGGQGYPPSISIDWYKKAYDNPVLFKSPTVLATSAGLKGFGDGSGAEIVMGLDKLRQLVGAQQQQPSVQIGRVEIVVNGAGKNAEQLGRELQAILDRKVAAYA